MFKGFDVRNGEEWASVLYSTGLKEVNYVGGAAVRKLIVGTEGRLENMQILTTNESPPSEPIPFHHELAQTPNPPDHIMFYCLENAATGGSTPVLRSDLVYNFLNEKYPDFIKEIEDKGVKYRRTVPCEDDPTSAQGRSWKSMFHVKTREEAEVKMAAQNFTWEWHENGNCTWISPMLPAVRVSSNGAKTFYNQLIAAYTGWVDTRNEYGKCVTFGDGSPLPADIINDLNDFMTANACAFKWSNGQFAVVDNSVAYHSRQPFSGKRRVFAAIAQGTKPVATDFTSVVLTSGDKMPSVGFGCWKVPKDQTAELVYNAIKNGYRLIDEAALYGNEVEAGLGIRRAIEEGLVTRRDLFVTSKLAMPYHKREHVPLACERILKDLGLEYLDLFLIHWPCPYPYVDINEEYPPKLQDRADARVPIRETWEAMEDLVKRGLVRNVGVSNFGVSQIRDMLSYAKVKPAALQMELHPYHTAEKVLRFCREKGIAVTAYSSFGANSYVEMNAATADQSCLNEQCVQEIAAKHGKTAAQVVLRWAVQRGTCVIPKSSKAERQLENRDLFSFNLSDAEMAAISSLNRDLRFCDLAKLLPEEIGQHWPIFE